MNYKTSYVSILGKALTPNSTVMKTDGITGPLTGDALSDWFAIPDAEELVVNFTIQSVGGTSPALSINFLILDPIEPSNGISPSNTNPPLLEIPVVQNSSVTGTVRIVIANGQCTIWTGPGFPSSNPTPFNLNVPFKWQVQFQVNGVLPSFSIIGTYEARMRS